MRSQGLFNIQIFEYLSIIILNPKHPTIILFLCPTFDPNNLLDFPFSNFNNTMLAMSLNFSSMYSINNSIIFKFFYALVQSLNQSYMPIHIPSMINNAIYMHLIF